MSTEPSTPLDLAAIRAREEKATEGPWSADSDQHTPAKWERGYGQFHAFSLGPTLKASVADGDACERALRQAEADADFIANARDDIPALLDEVERLQKENEQLCADKTAFFFAFLHDPTVTEADSQRAQELIREHGWHDCLPDTAATHGLGAQGEEEDAA
jgi:hypothetical protein